MGFMQRYFVNALMSSPNDFEILNPDAHHIKRVMRMKINDEIICSGGMGNDALCKIISIEDNSVRASVIERLTETNGMPIEITIVQAIPKGDKFECILQKGTELGAHAFIPWQAERSVSIWDDKKFLKKQQRFNKIAKEAAEQSHRSLVPTITEPVNEKELLELAKDYDKVLFAYEEESRRTTHHSLADVFKTIKHKNRVLICIGPEGGFSKDEAETFIENGWDSVRLGPRILRTETAPLYLLASISYHFEELENS